MRKILYSPGYGAGWSTWNSGEVAKYMLTYQPIIDFLEAGGRFTHDDCDTKYKKTPDGALTKDAEDRVIFDESNIHPLLKQLQRECADKFGQTYVCVLGAHDLKVAEVSGRVRIHEYDGSESLEGEGEFSDWV